MRSWPHFFVIGMLLVIGLGLWPFPSTAQDLLEGTQFPKRYLVQLSGTVLNETFSGAQALLTLMPPATNALNPYQLIVEGFPKRNSRNSFYWNAEQSEMTAIANEITCDIKRTFIKPVNMHFFFLSPELLRHTGADPEGEKAAERTALPTVITARAGKLRVRIHSDSVAGTIWMKGYDPIERSFVQYSARLYGKRASDKLQPKQQVQKGSTVRE
jgi:hypothetical protein